MYAHQVIEDMNNWLDFPPGTDVSDIKLELLLSVLKNIPISHKFVFSTFDSLANMFKKKYSKDDKSLIFLDDVEYLRFPYPNCWFEFDFSDQMRCGVFVQSTYDPDDFFVMPFYKQLDGDHHYWVPDVLALACRIGADFDDIPHNIRAITVWKTQNFDLDYSFERNSRMILTFLLFALKLLSCQNIGTKAEYPDKRLQRSRQKKNKGPLFKYHTLVLKPVTKRQKALAAQGLWTNIIHWSMGHYKNYPPPGLFCKYPGRFWWQALVRGDKTKGVLEKDYLVKTDKGE